MMSETEICGAVEPDAICLALAKLQASSPVELPRKLPESWAPERARKAKPKGKAKAKAKAKCKIQGKAKVRARARPKAKAKAQLAE